jgi:hypothetical protein
VRTGTEAATTAIGIADGMIGDEAIGTTTVTHAEAPVSALSSAVATVTGIALGLLADMSTTTAMWSSDAGAYVTDRVATYVQASI